MEAAGLYNDFGNLASLRSEARVDSAGTLDEVAQQFESLFVQMMLKSMRDATPEGGLFDSHQLETYEQMYDQQLSLDLARQGGVGLADVIVRQLGGAEPDASMRPGNLQGHDAARDNRAGMTLADPRATGAADTGVGLDAYRVPALPIQATPAATSPTRLPGPAASNGGDATAAPVEDSDTPFAATPAAFVEQLRPLATRAAAELGADPDVLLAQAALETGWGRRVIAGARGTSNNLFNIKAGADWTGPSVAVSTLEYQDGVAVREKATFRAYASPADSFADYVAFLRDNPRYSAVLNAAGSQEGFVRSLQAAGYATDPAYADKILDILGRGELRAGDDLAEAGAALKKTVDRPLAG